MIRASLSFLIVAAWLCPLCADETKPDEKELLGTWTPLSAEMAGKPFPDEVLKTIKLQMTKGKYVVTVGGEKDEGTAQVDAKKTPKTMDIQGTNGPNQGKRFLAIYELRNDRLKICYDLSGKAYPLEFATKPKTPLFLITYQREKP